VKDIQVSNCMNCLDIGSAAKRVTVEDVTIQHTNGVAAAPYPSDFSVAGTQVLLNRSRALNAIKSFAFVTQSRTTGPNVLLNFQATNHNPIEPHQRWATGLLVDGADLTGSIRFVNRATWGTGHGWSIGWGVTWNGNASYDIRQPPGTRNWSIGGIGPFVGDGTFESTGVHVSPASLYLAQLCVRKGPQALGNLGYR